MCCCLDIHPVSGCTTTIIFLKFHLIYFDFLLVDRNFYLRVGGMFLPSSISGKLTGLTYFYFSMCTGHAAARVSDHLFYHFLPSFLGHDFCYHADVSMAHTVTKQCGTAALSLTTRSNNMTSFHISDVTTNNGLLWSFFPPFF